MSVPVERRERTRAGSEALARVGQMSRLLRVLAIAVGVYIAAAVTVASVIGVVNSFRAADYAHRALEQSQVNGDIGELIRSCVEATPVGDPPTKCVSDSEARTGQAVAAIVDADGNGVLDAVEVRAALERIERAVTR